MDDERLRCAETALRQVPEDYRKVNAADVAGRERGHSFHRGMHIGWAWGEDEGGRPYLDFLSEHRHPGMQAERYFTDGRTESIATPGSMRAVSPDPAKDAEIEREFFESNRAAYADLRDRGLLPPEGGNMASQDINEYLLKGGSPTGGGAPDAASTAVGASDVRLGGGWDELLREELDKPYWPKLLDFLAHEYENHEVYPPWAQIFNAFRVDAVRRRQGRHSRPGSLYQAWAGARVGVLCTGRCHYPSVLAQHSQGTGRGPRISLSDLPDHGDLTAWAEQGVLLLNTTLTVRRRKSNSHVGMGWETFTDAVISAISTELKGVVFILWGGAAQKKARLIDPARHPAPIKAAHPKAWANARNPLAGSKPFTTANKRLAAAGRSPVNWTLLDGTPQDR